MTWARASLRITSSTLSVADIADRTGLRATRTHERGSLLSPRIPTSPRRDAAVWITDSGLPSNVPMQDHLDALFRAIEPHRDELRRLAPSATLDLFLGWSHEGAQGSFSLEPQYCFVIGLIGASIVVDIYTDESDAAGHQRIRSMSRKTMSRKTNTTPPTA